MVSHIKINLYFIFLCLVALVTWFWLISIDYKGYSHTFSDWRNAPVCDFVTNTEVYRWYNKRDAEYFRIHNAALIQKTIDEKGEITVGIDYYAFYGFCAPMIPREILTKYAEGLSKGKVYYLRFVNDKDS